MRNDGAEHLSSDDISRLAEESLGAGVPQEAAAGEAAAQHLSGCARCDRLFAEQLNIGNQLHRLEVQMSVPPSAGCPPDDMWLELAGGLLGSSEAQRLSLHAAECDHCGPMLRAAVEDFSPHLSTADRELITRLLMSTSEGRRKLASLLAERAHISSVGSKQRTATRSGWRRFFSNSPKQHGSGWHTFVPAGVAAMIALAAGLIIATQAPTWFGANRSKPDVDKLLASAYSQNRQIELRMRGADYAPLATSRGVAGAHTGTELRIDGGAPNAPDQNRSVDLTTNAEQEPIPLQKADGEIADHLEKNPEDPYWLRAQAVAETLRQRPRAAIPILLKLQPSQPDSSEIMNDLATAYFTKWQQSNDFTDLIEALNWVARAYQATLGKPDPVIVFNYALILEKANLKQNAKETWDKYLSLDSSSKWADEARSHRADLSELIQQHQLGPFGPFGPSEPYLDEAVTSWLPAAFPVERVPDRDARERLELLSTLLVSQHQDDWLRQLLSGKGTDFARAIVHLAAAVSDNSADRYESAQQNAARAAMGFAASGNHAGVIRSRYEEVYALLRRAQGKSCWQAANALASQLQSNHFYWIELQNLLALNSCAQISGLNMPEAAELPHIAELATRLGYSSLELRAEGFMADNTAAQDVPGDCIRVSMRGLGTYWATPYEKPARAYNFYQAMAELAEDASFWELAYDFNRESAIVLGKSHLLEAADAWTHAAQSANALGRVEDARAALANSEQLLRQVKEPATAALYSADNALWGAQFALQQNQVNAARQSLELVSQLLPRNPTTGELAVDDYTITLPYYTLQTRVARAQRDWSAASNHLQSALKEAEQDRKSLKDYHDRLMWTREVGGIYRELVALDLDSLQSPEKALVDWEHYRALPEQESASSSHSAGATFAHLLTAGGHPQSPSSQPEFFLTFVVTPERTATLLLGEDGAVHGGWCPGSAKQIQAAQRDFARSLGSPSTSLPGLRKQAQALSNTLLGPVWDALPQRAILIVQPDDGAGEVPLYALLDRQGQYLAERFTVVIAPHTPASWQLPGPGGLPAMSSALVVRAEQPPGVRTLSDLRPETDAVRAAYPHTTELAGTAASRAAIMKYLPGAALFHFAGHSYEMSNSSGLLLATGEIAGPDAVAQAETSHLQLVVLSACFTARSRFAARDDQSLLGAFLARGVPYVIATDWDVNSQITTTYMQALYRHLGQGVWVAEAVRLADLDMLKGKNTQSPFYWAGFRTFITM